MTNTTSTTQPQLIAAAMLDRSPLNARRTHRADGMDELKASILAHGLMQNLVVTAADGDHYLVIAGGRRLQAIHALQAEGKLPADFAVPCQVVTEDDALEMSLAENTVRLAMHPADQFAAFADLIDKGASADEVARRFGIDESLVHKRMKLGRVAPELLAEYRGDGMTLECLMAYTLTDDHRRQRKVFKSLTDWQKEDPAAIRNALSEKMIDAESKLALFVGVDAYMEAGGTSRADLFGEEVYLEKPALLNKLAEKKLDTMRRELEAEGWSWIEINPERDWNLINRCTRIKPMLIGAPSELVERKAQLDSELEALDPSHDDEESEQVEEELVAFVGFDADHKALAGCFVSIGHDGAPFIEKGLVRPEQRKQLAKLLKTDERNDEPSKAKAKGSLSVALRKDLAVCRLQVAQVEIAKHPLLAFDLLVFQVAQALLDKRSGHEAAEVEFKRPRQQSAGAPEPTAASSKLEELAQALPRDWLSPDGEGDRFEEFRLLSEASKLDILAYCMALTLKPKLAPATGDEATAYDITLSLTAASVSDYWRPTAENFLGRITREQLLAISRATFGDAWAQSHGDVKKATLANRLSGAFSNPESSGQTPERMETLKRWLPEGMAFDIAGEIKPAKARKARKAA